MNNTKTMKEILGKERATFEDVSVLEELKTTLLKTLEDTAKDFNETADAYASVMTLTDLSFVEVTDEMKLGIVGSMLKGAIAGAVMNELVKQIKELDDLIEFNKEDSVEKKVIDFAEKKAEKEAEATASEDAMAEALTGLLMGALIGALQDEMKGTKGEA